MQFEVYHAVNPTFIPTVPVDFPKGFELVAKVECEDLEDVFRVTNHIDDAWWLNREVGWYKDGSRSTSVGDVVVDENKVKHLCDMAGWKQF